MYLNVDDIKFALVYIYRLTFFPILESDYKIAGSLLCVPIFLPLGSNFVFVLYKLNKKEIDNFLKKPLAEYMYLFFL